MFKFIFFGLIPLMLAFKPLLRQWPGLIPLLKPLLIVDPKQWLPFLSRRYSYQAVLAQAQVMKVRYMAFCSRLLFYVTPRIYAPLARAAAQPTTV